MELISLIQNPLITSVPVNGKYIAFTFDDGPDLNYTEQILELFQAVNGKATFYMIGSQIEKNEHIAKLVHQHGHEIGNHTYSHPYLTRLTVEECQQELVRTSELIEGITGQKPTTFRPPYIDYNDEVGQIASELQYQSIGAINSNAKDWNAPGVQFIVDKTLEALHNGGILLFHDGGGDRSQTVEAVRILIEHLTQQGYTLVTVQQLLERATN